MTNADDSFDVIVIGSGPGGYICAIRAASLGLKTLIIEKENVGGVCLNWGCIPTKALLRSAEIFNLVKGCDQYGIKASGVGFDFSRVIQRSREVVKKLNMGISGLLKKQKVTVVLGTAEFSGAGAVDVTPSDGGKPKRYTAKNIVIATGARPRVLSGLEPDGKQIWDYKAALKPERLPDRIVILGAGAIGVEFASFYHAFGSKVTLMDLQSAILPLEDADVSRSVAQAFSARGIDIRTGAMFVSCEKRRKTGDLEIVVMRDDKKEKIIADVVLVATGITANTESLSLDKAGVEKDSSGHIVVDACCRTSAQGVWAIGDVASSPPWLAHKAAAEGSRVAEVISGKHVTFPKPSEIPSCIYASPQVASVGMTEKAVKELGIECKIGKFPLSASGKAIAMGEEYGFVKTIFDAHTGEILGAHMVGAEVTEIIHSYVIGRTLETTEVEFMQAVFPHPTVSEAVQESVMAAWGRPLHV